MLEALEELGNMMNHIADDKSQSALMPAVAKMLKRLYDEMIAVGFTPEQALQIATTFKLNNG